MSLELDMQALRQGVAWSQSLKSCFHLSGPRAVEAMNSLCPRELYIRDGQMLQTLLLDAEAKPIADMLVCAEGDDFLLLIEAAPGLDLGALFAERLPLGNALSLADLSVEYELIGIDGPYAWELLSELLSPEVIGLPYLGFYRNRNFLCFRAGSSGEFSYQWLIPKTEAAAWRERLLRLGAAFDLRQVSQEALDLGALENFFFNVRRDSIQGITPVELQLGWRVSMQKTFVGCEALRHRRAQAQQRVALYVSDRFLPGGSVLRSKGDAVGAVLHSTYSPDYHGWLGLALVHRHLAYTGVEFQADEDGASLCLLSAPAVNNRSLYVDPQRHSYSNRGGQDFPPLIALEAR